MNIILEGGDFAGRTLVIENKYVLKLPTCSGAICIYKRTSRVFLGRLVYEFIGDKGQLVENP